jgi:hypothetical protein
VHRLHVPASGLDVVSIVLTLSYVFLASVTLSVVGLLLGTLTRSRHWNTLLSVLFLIGLLIVAFTSFQFTAILVMAHPPLDTASFWITNLLVVTILGSFLVLAILAAAGNISFASDNRSTRLRIVMFVQQMLFIGALTYGWLMGEDAEILLMLIGLVASYWMFMGTLMIGESGQLSLRARRRLPTSFLSRACFTWFNPGPGTGYLFAVLNLFTVWLIYVAMLTASQLTGFRGQPDSPGWLLFGSLTVAYAALFLGLDRILLLLMNRLRISITMLTSLLVQICLLLVTSSVPFIVTLWASDFRGAEYSLLQCPNWLWTLQAAAFGMYDTPHGRYLRLGPDSKRLCRRNDHHDCCFGNLRGESDTRAARSRLRATADSASRAGGRAVTTPNAGGQAACRQESISRLRTIHRINCRLCCDIPVRDIAW